MKRLILAILGILILTAGAAMAQSTINTAAPGPTQQQEPGQTNNNLPNPGHPIAAPGAVQAQPLTEHGTTEGTATESMQREQSSTATTSTTPSTTTTTTTTTATGSTSGSAYDSTTPSTDTTTDTTTSGDTGSLPATGSEMPLVGLIGLASLGAALALRALRN